MTTPNPLIYHVVIIDLSNPTATAQAFKDFDNAVDAATAAELKNNQFYIQGITTKRANIVVDIDPTAPINPPAEGV